MTSKPNEEKSTKSNIELNSIKSPLSSAQISVDKFSNSDYQFQNSNEIVQFQYHHNIFTLPKQLEQNEELKNQLWEYQIQLDIKYEQKCQNQYNHLEQNAALYAVLLLNLMHPFNKNQETIQSLIGNAEKNHNNLIKNKLLQILNQSLAQNKFNQAIEEILSSNTNFQIIMEFIINTLEQSEKFFQSSKQQQSNKYSTTNILNTLSQQFEVVIIFCKEYDNQSLYEVYSNDKVDNLMKPIIILFQNQKNKLYVHHTAPHNNIFQHNENHHNIKVDQISETFSVVQNEEYFKNMNQCIESECMFQSLILIKYMSILIEIEENYKLNEYQVNQQNLILWRIFEKPLHSIKKQNKILKDTLDRVNKIMKESNQSKAFQNQKQKLYSNLNQILKVLYDYELEQINKVKYVTITQDELNKEIFKLPYDLRCIKSVSWFVLDSRFYILLPEQYGIDVNKQQESSKLSNFMKYLFPCLKKKEKQKKENNSLKQKLCEKKGKIQKKIKLSMINQRFRLLFESEHAWNFRMKNIFSEICKQSNQYQQNNTQQNRINHPISSISTETSNLLQSLNINEQLILDAEKNQKNEQRYQSKTEDKQILYNNLIKSQQPQVIPLQQVKIKKSKLCKCGAVIDLIYKEYPYCNNCFIKLTRQCV